MSNPNQIDKYAVQSAGFQAMDSRIDVATAEDFAMSTPDNVDRHFAAGQEVARLLAEARVTQGVHPTDQAFHDGSRDQSDAARVARDASQEDNKLREHLAYGSEGYTPATEAEREATHANRERARSITADTRKTLEG